MAGFSAHRTQWSAGCSALSPARLDRSMTWRQTGSAQSSPARQGRGVTVPDWGWRTLTYPAETEAG